MEKIPKQVYTKAFREQAAKLVLQDGMSVPEAARRLSMSAKTLANWVHFAQSGKLIGREAQAGKGLIHHSDRGSQYCSHEYQRLVQQFGMKASMSRRGNCYDNAPMESFWGTLKNELVHHRRYETRQQAISEITEYIEIFYNRQSRHSRLGYVAPQFLQNSFISSTKQRETHGVHY